MFVEDALTGFALGALPERALIGRLGCAIVRGLARGARHDPDDPSEVPLPAPAMLLPAARRLGYRGAAATKFCDAVLKEAYRQSWLREDRRRLRAIREEVFDLGLARSTLQAIRRAEEAGHEWWVHAEIGRIKIRRERRTVTVTWRRLVVRLAT